MNGMGILEPEAPDELLPGGSTRRQFGTFSSLRLCSKTGGFEAENRLDMPSAPRFPSAGNLARDRRRSFPPFDERCSSETMPAARKHPERERPAACGPQTNGGRLSGHSPHRAAA